MKSKAKDSVPGVSTSLEGVGLYFTGWRLLF